MHLEGFESVIEGAYLEETLTPKRGTAKVFFEPINETYVINSTIILGTGSYPISKIEELLKNQCKIISRIKVPEGFEDSIEFSPYQIRVCPTIMWNGETLDSLPSSEFFNENFRYNEEDKVVYIPKILNGPFLDEDGNLTTLGWAQQQVGNNVRKDTPFLDLDLIKTEKVL